MTNWGRPEKFGERVPELRDDEVDHAAARPGDAMDGPAVAEANLQSLADKQDVVDLFRRLLAVCLPAKGYGVRMGAGRHWQAGYHRMVAIAYCVTPEMFNGMKPQEVAATLGVSWWAFRKQLRAVRDMLEARQAAAGRRRR